MKNKMNHEFYVQTFAQNTLICSVGTYVVSDTMSTWFLVLSVVWLGMTLCSLCFQMKEGKEND